MTPRARATPAAGGRSGAETASDAIPQANVVPVPLVLVVPMPENVTNKARGSTHWRRHHSAVAAYWRSLDAIAAVSRHGPNPATVFHIPEAPAVPLHNVVVRSAMVLGGAMDDDNAMARHKHLADWLVANGYVATDRRERKKDGASFRWAEPPAQRVSRKEVWRITLTLQPVHAASAFTIPERAQEVAA